MTESDATRRRGPNGPDSDADIDLTAIAQRAAEPKRSPVDYMALVLALAAGMLLFAGVLYAFAVAGARDVDGSERFRLLAQASSPFVPALTLAAIVLLYRERERGDADQVGGVVVMTASAVIALVALLLAVNGIVVDLTTAGIGMLFRVSNVIGRLATVVLGGLSLWLSAAAPAPARLEPPKLGPDASR